jgi:inner membrane transporter RhtA
VRRSCGGGASVGPALLVVVAATVQEVGAAVAVSLLTAVGAVGAVFIRFAVAGAVLWLAARPRLRGLSGRAWTRGVALACALTSMNVCFYQALARIPLGIAVTIEVCGPLVLSVALGRRLAAWLWAVLAFAGVALLGLVGDHTGGIQPWGYVWAAGAAVSWAAYILASARAAAVFPKLDGLVIATSVGALVTAPLAAVSVPVDAALHWRILMTGIAVGLMSSVIPYSLEMVSLRTLPAGTFAVLTCLSPVIATVAGWAVLGQELHPLHYVAIALVTMASIGAVRTAHSRVGPAEAV